MIRTLAFLMAVLLPSMVLAQAGQKAPASAAASTGAGPNPAEMAQVLYTEAHQMYYQGKFKEALAKFSEAYTFDQNATLKFNICKTMEKLRDPEASLCFQEYIGQYPTDNGIGYAKNFLDQKPQPPASAPAPHPAAPASVPTSGTLVIQGISEESTARVDNVEVTPSDIRGNKPILLTVGSHAITVLDSKSNVIGKGQVRIDGGKSTTWTFVAPEEAPFFTRKQWGWTSIGVGALAAAAAGYFTYAMSTNFAEADKRNGNHDYTVGEFRSAVSNGESDRTLAIVSAGVAVLAGGLGAYLVLTGDDESPTAAIAPSFGGLVITGAF